MRKNYKFMGGYAYVHKLPSARKLLSACGCLILMLTISASEMTAQTALCQDIARNLPATTNINANELNNGSSGFSVLYIGAIGTTDVTVSCGDHPTLVLTLIASDGTNTSSCTSTVTFTDTDLPTPYCQNITADVGDVIVPGDIDLGSSDNCTSPVTLDINGNSDYTVVCGDVGTINLDMNVTDVDGNSDFCTITVTVSDNAAPTAVCQDITVQLDAAGTKSIVAADVDGGSSDNCPATLSLGIDVSSFTCAEIGANTVTLTATADGGTDNCISTVTVEDNVDPAITCITGTLTVNLDAAGNASIVEADIIAGSSDACGTVTEALDAYSFSCTADLGTHTITATADDGNGNTNTCTRDINVVDVDMPTAICADITVNLDASGNGSIIAADVDGGSSDNCTAGLSASPTAFTCAEVGANSVTLTVDDGSTTAATCTATVTVEDNEEPDPICAPHDVTLSGPENTATIIAADIDGGSTDACGSAGLSIDIGEPFISEFHYDNASTDVGEFIEVSGLAGISLDGYTIYLYNGSDSELYNSDSTFPLSGTLSGTDCGAFALSLPSGGLQNGPDGIALVGPSGVVEFISYEGTITAADGPANGMTSTDIGVSESSSTAVGGSLSLEDGGWVVTTTNSSGTYNSGLTCVLPFDCSTLGAQTVILTVTDVNGNDDTCAATVTVHEQTGALSAVCQNITLDLNASTTITPADIDGGSVGDCSLWLNNANPFAFDCTTLGPQTVMLVVTDDGGANTSTCNATVDVINPVSPVAQCPANPAGITVQLTGTTVTITTADVDSGSFAEWTGNSGTTDYCGTAVDLSLDITDFDCTDVGKTPTVVTMTASISGVAATSACQTNVTVTDMTDPTAVCQDVTIQTSFGEACVTAMMVDNGSSDECNSLILGLDQTNFTCNDLGANTVTLTASDASGNSSTCTATITVEDVHLPTPICQNIAVNLGATTGTYALTASEVNNGSHDQEGTTSTGIYSVAGTCSVSFVDISGTGTALDPDCDDCAVGFTTTNSYLFYGVPYTDFSAGANGGLVLGTLAGFVTWFNSGVDGVSSTGFPEIYPFWDDLTVYTFDGSNIFWEETGGSLIVQWNNVLGFGAPFNQATFQVQISGTGEISFAYDDIDFGNSKTDGGSATIGLENNDGTNLVQYSYNTAQPGLTCISNAPSAPGVAIDNCSAMAALTFSIDGGLPTFDCTMLGPNTVDLWVTDESGNSASCAATVTVADVDPPTITCMTTTVTTPLDVILDANGNVTLTEQDLLSPPYSDPCLIAGFNISPSTFGCGDVDNATDVDATVTISAFDGTGNTSTSCDVYVNILDNEPPAITCQNITRNEDYTVFPGEFLSTFTDACGINTTAFDMAFTDMSDYYDCNSVGTYNYTIYTSDVNDNISSCTAELTIQSTGSLQVNCIATPTVIIDENTGLATIPPPMNNWASWSDNNCTGSTLNVSLSQPTFDCYDEYFSNGNTLATVMITVTDNGGNSATDVCSFNVRDNSTPTASNCPTTIPIVDVSLDPGTLTAVFDANVIAAAMGMTIDANVCSDHYFAWGNLVPTVNQDNCVIQNGGSFPLANGGTLSSSDDQIHPVSVDCNDDGLLYGANIAPASFSSGVNLGNSVFPPANLGCSYFDQPCAVYLRVVSATPVAVCQDITVDLDNSGSVTVAAAMVDNGSTDDCNNFFYSLSASTFDCTEVGDTMVVLTVIDGSASSSCPAIITVEDNIDPIAMCKNVTVNLDPMGVGAVVTAADFDNGSSDNCVNWTEAISSPSVDLTLPFDCNNHGNVYPVEYTVTDASGNTHTVNCQLTVEDVLPPTVVCQDITVQMNQSASVTWTAADLYDPASSDNCATSLSIVPASFGYSGCGLAGMVTAKTISVTDGNGNTGTATCDVTIQGPPPVANCQPAFTVGLNSAGVKTIDAELDLDNGSLDNCDASTDPDELFYSGDISFNCDNVGNTITVTLTVEDNDGFTSTCTTDITVADYVAPTPVCATVTVQLDANGSYTLDAVEIDGGSTDNCGPTTPSIAPTTFGCGDVGTQQVHLTVTDLSNNFQTTVTPCTVYVTNPAPVAVCQDYMVTLVSGAYSLTPADLMSMASSSSEDCNTTLTLTPDITNISCTSGFGGVVPVVVTVDNGFESDNCTSNVTIDSAPDAVCQDITVMLGLTDDVTITAAQIDGGSSSSCGVLSVGISSAQTTFGCDDVGMTIPVTLSANDGISFSSCVANVTIALDPTLPCQCIPDYRIATDNPIPDPVPDGYYPAIIDIETNAIVPVSGAVEFKAGNSILMLPGFEVKGNTVFLAHIGPCP